MTVSTHESDELRDDKVALLQRLEEAEATIRAISNHEVDAFLVRKGAEEQVLVLDGVDRPYRLLIERMQQGAATVASDGSVIYANRRLAEMLLVPAATLIGRSLQNHVVKSDRTVINVLLQESRVDDVERELTLLRGDGSTLPVLVTASPLIEHDGITCLIVTDLTQQKLHEAEREGMLREKSARAAAENLAAVLREADLRKDEFLATLGHELRNPLGPLSHGLQILNRISSQDPVIQKTRDMMARQIECLVRLVDDLLDVGRVTQGKIVLQKQCVDLRDVVRRAVEGGGLHIDERGHKLELRMSDKPLPVDVDVIRIAQIVTNLLSNAAKFTNPGSGLIQLDCEQSGAEAVVRLRDNGRGIAPEMLPKIFDLFTQADPTESRTEGGLGIGLTLARRLAEMHGGRLEASSKGLAQGSEFVLRLPLADSRELAPVNASGTKPVSARNKTARHRILIVDDNEDSAQSLLTLLDILGHDVRQANSGTLALELAAEFVPDVVLLDLGMPGMSGYDVARAFQTQSNLRDLCIIALSGYGSEEDRRRTHSAGFYHHLVKPIDFAALESVLASLPANE